MLKSVTPYHDLSNWQQGTVVLAGHLNTTSGQLLHLKFACFLVCWHHWMSETTTELTLDSGKALKPNYVCLTLK